MFLWIPITPQAAQVGSGFFYVIALGYDAQCLWGPYEAGQQRVISRGSSLQVGSYIHKKAGIKAQRDVEF
jgi:hypothetical protein